MPRPRSAQIPSASPFGRGQLRDRADRSRAYYGVYRGRWRDIRGIPPQSPPHGPYYYVVSFSKKEEHTAVEPLKSFQPPSPFLPTVGTSKRERIVVRGATKPSPDLGGVGTFIS